MTGCVFRQLIDLAAVEPTQDRERSQQFLAALFSGKRQTEKGRQIAAQVDIAGAQFIKLAALLEPLELAATLRRLLELVEADSLAYPRSHILAVRRRGEQDIDREQHRLHAFARSPAQLAVA